MVRLTPPSLRPSSQVVAKVALALSSSKATSRTIGGERAREDETVIALRRELQPRDLVGISLTRCYSPKSRWLAKFEIV